jgi:hypothetical protein
MMRQKGLQLIGLLFTRVFRFFTGSRPHGSLSARVYTVHYRQGQFAKLNRQGL